MGQIIKLEAADGFQLSAYRADPDGQPKGGVVVVQEIFGVNSHIRSVVDRFAANGYAAIAPAVFDRVETGVELNYDKEGMGRGFGIVGKLDWDNTLADIKAAATALGEAGNVAVVGFCWGGTAAWLSAARIDLPAVCYYGGNIADFAGEPPKQPTMLHFGADDNFITPEHVETIRAANPDLPIHVYAGTGHGFNCDQRDGYDAQASAQAFSRTLEFLAVSVG